MSGAAIGALLAHGLAAVLWIALMPQGFPPAHLRFWSNFALPLALIGGIVCSLFGAHPWRSAGMLGLAALWGAASAALALLFPQSGRLPSLLCGTAGLGCLAIALLHFRLAPPHLRGGLAWCGSAAVMGSVVPLAQRAPDAATRPIGGALPGVRVRTDSAGLVSLGHSARLRLSDGAVLLRCASLELELDSLLRFESRSPDRFWTNLAPAREREGGTYELRGWSRRNEVQRVAYASNDADAVLEAGTGNGVEVTTWTRLSRPVFSHLNSFSVLRISGHRQLSLTVSPCGALQVPAEPAGYPEGRPAQFGALLPDGQFGIFRARSGEKGPFRRLAGGLLPKDAPFDLMLWDGDQPVCRVGFPDWPAQASTSLSPAAGCGLPENAIELQRLGEAPDSPCIVWLSLAATSIGRGWDSVGHRAGVYRNRVWIRPVSADAQEPGDAARNLGIASEVKRLEVE